MIPDTTTHGAFGALALGIGFSECTHVLATQALWQPRYKAMRVVVSGRLSQTVGAKDLILAIIGRIGVAGGIGHIIEFAGPCISAMSMEERMTLCNMAIEAGARAGIIAADAKAFEYLRDRPYAPRGERWDAAVTEWEKLRSDPGAVYDREVMISVDELAPMVTWGTSPEDVVSIGGSIPDPALQQDAERRARWEAALSYMGLSPGTRISDIAIDRVFIGVLHQRLD